MVNTLPLASEQKAMSRYSRESAAVGSDDVLQLEIGDSRSSRAIDITYTTPEDPSFLIRIHQHSETVDQREKVSRTGARA